MAVLALATVDMYPRESTTSWAKSVILLNRSASINTSHLLLVAVQRAQLEERRLLILQLLLIVWSRQLGMTDSALPVFLESTAR